MYELTINFRNGETATITLPSIETVYMMAFRLNEDIYVNGTLIAARDGKHPKYPNSYFGGYTRGGIAALYGEKA